MQVDLAGETTKFGAPPGEIGAILDAAGDCRHVRVDGLMVLPPFQDDPEKSRPYFRRLRQLAQEWAGRGERPALTQLSMGMTEDFEVAIEEGATVVRVGRALFGERRTA